MKWYKKCLYVLYVLSIVLLVMVFDLFFYRQIPDTIYLRAGEIEEVNFALPVTGTMEEVKEEPYVQTFENNQKKIYNTNFIWKIKLLGIIPIKEISVEIVDHQYAYPIGEPTGIYVKTDGVLIAGLGNIELVDGTKQSPCENILQVGDYILSINNKETCKNKDVIDIIHNSNGNSLIFKIRRNSEVSEVKLNAKLTREGEYKIGAWLRDSAQGIGTITYIDENHVFGSLGHGINDIDTTKLMEIDYGTLYETQIVSVKKGTSGEPGELAGIIHFNEGSKDGTINKNTACGIYGILAEKQFIEQTKGINLYEIALKQDIKIGEAQIIATIQDDPQFYTINITDIDFSQSKGNRGLVIEITDPNLLRETGGIIQGMSGSPIIQNGKLVGAVTHVFVNDPTRGYGIFIENMLETAESIE